jgi:hypothetical protein
MTDHEVTEGFSPELKRFLLLELWFARMSESYAMARTLLRSAEERDKPDGNASASFGVRQGIPRIGPFRQADLPDLRFTLAEILTLLATELAGDPGSGAGRNRHRNELQNSSKARRSPR